MLEMVPVFVSVLDPDIASLAVGLAKVPSWVNVMSPSLVRLAEAVMVAGNVPTPTSTASTMRSWADPMFPLKVLLVPRTTMLLAPVPV